MKYIHTMIPQKAAAQIALGCMRIGDMAPAQLDNYLGKVLDLGYNFFDHADIYGGGACETVFGAALRRNPGWREQMLIQTKCGIRDGMYDFSKAHILASVEGSLKRLGLEQIDILLLHRPDLLMEPEEVAAAFDALESSGKVHTFGVSNHSPLQIELLQRAVSQPIKINQLQLSAANAGMLAGGATVNHPEGADRDGYVRDYCRLKNITIQAWSPLQHGFFEGPFLKSEKYEKLNVLLRNLGEKYGISDTAVAIAWLLRLPEKVQPVVGSTNPERLYQIARAADIVLSAEDWYQIYLAAGYCLP